MNRREILLSVSLLIALGILGRLLPHLPNMTPLSALAITGSLYAGKRWAVVLPIIVLFLSDMVLGVYDWRIMGSVYISFALIGILSALFARRGKLSSTFGLASTSSVLFFLITNAAVWLFSPWYEKTLFGLLYAYELGLPFLLNMAVGDIAYTGVLIGIFELSARTRKSAETKMQTV